MNNGRNMMNTIYNRKGIFAAAAALLLSAGCTQLEFMDPVDDDAIVFAASTEYENDAVDTRTEYSGQILGSTTKYERINWISGQDKVRVICNEATNVSDHKLDYTIGTVTTQSEKSQATVTGASGVFKWNNSVTDHYFYALYPSPDMTGAPSGMVFSVADQKATVKGSIPATQTGEWVASSRTYKPNMNYAYMYAAKVQSKGSNPTSESTHVTLEFKPLVTAMEFSLVADSHFPANLPLTKVEITSGTTNLAGNFTAKLDATTSTGLSGNPSVTGGTKTLTINLPSVVLSTTDPTTFTFLALPVQQKDLTLSLTFTDGTRSLLLATDAGNITVGARKKLYIRSLGVKPDAVYHLSVTGPEAHETLDSDGSDTGHYTVISYVEYKMGSSIVTEAVPWTAEFSVDGGKSWNTNPSGWTVPNPSGNGSLTGEERSAKADANTTQSTKKWEGSKDSVASSSTDAVDLSYRNYKGELQTKRSTANCYIVSAPGWYKIPLVYGNAITNDITITKSYSNNNSNAYSLKNFLRHDGQAIKGPWIPRNDESTTSDDITVDGAILCWQDNNAISTSDTNKPFVDGDYLYFRVRSGDQYLKQGNAVIAATSGGTVVWSWHIWIMEPQKLKVMQLGSHYMLNMNLGWSDAETTIPERTLMIKVTQNTSNEEGNTEIVQNAGDVFGGNVFYQFGRKDPMGGADGHYNPLVTSGSKNYTKQNVHFEWTKKDATDSRWYKVAGNDWIRYGSLNTPARVEKNGVKTLDTYSWNTKLIDAIKNPNVFYYTSKSYNVENGISDYEYQYVPARWVAQQGYVSVSTDHKQFWGSDFYDGTWHNKRYDNLWNADATFNSDVTIAKTVYDPSPAGFKVACKAAFDELKNLDITDLGWGYAVKTTDGQRMTFPRIALRNMDGELRDQSYSGENEVFIWAGLLLPYIDDSAHYQSGCYLQWNSMEGIRTDVRKGPLSYGMSVRPEVE